nr:hypothetical protein [Tanacetum cinerariifolium]
YPKLDIDLSPALRSISLDRHEADIAIRFDRPKDGDIIARPLVNVGFGFYGTDEACRSVEAGGNLVLIGFNEADGHLAQEKWVARHFPRARIAFRAKDQALHAVAARSGIGLAIRQAIGRVETGACRVGADAEAGGDAAIDRRTEDMGSDGLAHGFGQLDALFELAAGNEHGELFTAYPADGRVLAHDLPQAIDDAPNHGVAC